MGFPLWRKLRSVDIEGSLTLFFRSLLRFVATVLGSINHDYCLISGVLLWVVTIIMQRTTLYFTFVDFGLSLRDRDFLWWSLLLHHLLGLCDLIFRYLDRGLRLLSSVFILLS